MRETNDVQCLYYGSREKLVTHITEINPLLGQSTDSVDVQ